MHRQRHHPHPKFTYRQKMLLNEMWNRDSIFINIPLYPILLQRAVLGHELVLVQFRMQIWPHLFPVLWSPYDSPNIESYLLHALLLWNWLLTSWELCFWMSPTWWICFIIWNLLNIWNRSFAHCCCFYLIHT